jgi:tRNA wybutosine-synthesizing protein 2
MTPDLRREDPRQVGKSQRPPKRRQENRISSAIRLWISNSPLIADLDTPVDWPDLENELVDQGPKRYVVYEPIVLLSSGSFMSGRWASLLANAEKSTVDDLWRLILQEVSKTCKGILTHLAVNEGIPLHLDAAEGDQTDIDENIRRSPNGLRILYGDFGPPNATGGVGGEGFEKALWVSTRQNNIFQTWAPRWTMFSRGNVKEKTRLLQFHERQSDENSLASRVRQPAILQQSWAIDLYAGIGYFAFSYAKLGMRVLCWEVNPWSVEALRRGALQNHWSVRVVQAADLSLPSPELISGGEQIVVFLEDNCAAANRIQALKGMDIDLGRLLHINCGLLPTSEPVWKPSFEMAAEAKACWLHFHENVGVGDIESRKTEIQKMVDSWVETGDGNRKAIVEHVERVKTFAPGVWHCVFDVYITGHDSSDT